MSISKMFFKKKAMRRHGLRRKSLVFYKLVPEEKFKGKNNKAKNEHENADAIDAVHVFYKKGFRPVGVWFPEIEVVSVT